MIVNIDKKGTTPLGRVGENEARTICFDVKDILAEFPDATFTIVNQRPKDPAGYTVAGQYVSLADGHLYWSLQSGDLAREGIGKCEIIAMDGETIVKTEIYTTRTGAALDNSETPPDPWQSWVEEVIQAKDDAEAAADLLKNCSAEAETLDPGSDATASYANGVFSFGIPTGPRGETGSQGPAGPGIAAGGTTGQVLKKKSDSDYDTEWSDDASGVQIDDTAGIGDTGVTWSANKSATGLSVKYEKPFGGIPATDMENSVQASLGKADTAYQKPDSGIPASDIENGVIPDISGKIDSTEKGVANGVATLGGDGKVPSSQLPSYVDDVVEYASLSAFPATGESGKIYVALDTNKTYRWSGSAYIEISSSNVDDVQVNGTSVVNNGIANVDISGKADKVSSATNGNFAGLDSNGNLTDSGSKASDFGTYSKPSGGIPGTDLADSYIKEPSSDGTSGQVLTTDGNGGRTWTTPSGGVSDVQVNGTSVVSNGVANVPIGGSGILGVVKSGNGVTINNSTGTMSVVKATDSQVKTGTEAYCPLVPASQEKAVFYGLSKLAGEDLKNDTVTVGTYPEKSLSAISNMLNAPVSVSGSTPSITAKSGVRYICGECSTLSITAPASGCIDVLFTSGSTATVLTVSSAKTGVSAIKWAGGFDPTSLEANTTYEVNILDGEFGVVGSWT